MTPDAGLPPQPSAPTPPPPVAAQDSLGPQRPWWRRWSWLFQRRPPGPATRRREAVAPTARGPRQRARRFSPLTRRILLLNTLPVGFLAASVVFLGDYEQELVEADISSLRVQAEIVAAAIGEAAVSGGETTVNRIERDPANLLMVRLVTPNGVRGRLFGENGEMLGDTRVLLEQGGKVAVEALPPPADAPRPLLDRLADWADRRLRGVRPFPRYVEHANPTPRDYPEVDSALRGNAASAIRAERDGRLIISTAIPVQRYKQILGALMLSHDDRAIAASLRQVRMDIFKIALVAFSVTVMLSLYLASTIVLPVQRLARAADRIRLSRDDGAGIPQLSERRDEIGDLAESLRGMTEALQRRMDAIESFAADVAHELKNPLTSLRSAVETLSFVKDPVAREKLMRIVLDDADRLNRLISDISDASRLDAELMRAEFRPVDVRALLETLLDTLRQTSAAKANVSLRMLAMGAPPFRALGHDRRYSQVFRNVVENAISFSPAGSTITVGLMRERSEIVVTIDDQGPGIPEEALESVFKRFYSSRPEAQFGQHSGLGLAICRQIVETYGGSIGAGNLTDADGARSGARFTVRLPAAG